MYIICIVYIICFRCSRYVARSLTILTKKVQMLTRDCRAKTVLSLHITNSVAKAFAGLAKALDEAGPDIEKSLTKIPPKTAVPMPMIGVDVDLESITSIDELYSALETPLE